MAYINGLERIASSTNVFVGPDLASARSAAIAGTGTSATLVPRQPVWENITRFTNDNGTFANYSPAVQDPDYIWDSVTENAQFVSFSVASQTQAVSADTSLSLYVTAMSDNALQMQIDLVDATTGTIIPTSGLSILLTDGSFDPTSGITTDVNFPYNWQNVYHYSISTPPLAAGSYQLVLSFNAVNYDQLPGRANPAGLQFLADLYAATDAPTSIILNKTTGTNYSDLATAVGAASSGDTLYLYPGTFSVTSRLTIDKSLTITGASRDSVLVDFDSLPVGLEIKADNVTIENLHLRIATQSGDTWLFQVDTKTPSYIEPVLLYTGFTLQSSIIEGGKRNGYINAENMTIQNNLFIINSNANNLQLASVQGTTAITDNIFEGGPNQQAVLVFEGSTGQVLNSGTISVTNNTATNYDQFLRYNARTVGVSLIATGNMVNHGTRVPGTNVKTFVFLPFQDFTQFTTINFSENTADNSQNTGGLFAYVDYQYGGPYVPAPGQIQVNGNTMIFPKPWGQPTDLVDPNVPVGVSANGVGATPAIYNLVNNTVIIP